MRQQPKPLLTYLFLACCLVSFSKASAQVAVNLSMERSLYIAYEPLLVTTSLKNLSGNPLLLTDDNDAYRWFGFRIETLSGTPILPNDPHYEMPPLTIASGETRSCTINITSHYPITDFGSYRIRAMVYVPEFHRYFSSPPLTIEITEGRLLWQQSIATPSTHQEKITTRNISLLSHRLPDHTSLYLRIEDKDEGLVFCTHCLGSFMTYRKPEILIDAKNHIHVLHNEAPGLFTYTHVDIDGKIINRKSFAATKTSPSLTLTKQGLVAVIGGTVFDPSASSATVKSSNLTQQISSSPAAAKNKKKTRT